MSELELFLDLEDRRVAERFPDGLPVTLTANGGNATILNISLTGVKFIVPTDSVSNEMALRFETDEIQWSALSRTVWCNEVGPAHSAVGVEFFQVEDDRKLRFLLQTLAKI